MNYTISLPSFIFVEGKKIYFIYQKQKINDCKNNFYIVFFSWYAPIVVDQINFFPRERTIFCCNSKEEQVFLSYLNFKSIFCPAPSLITNTDIFFFEESPVVHNAIYNAGMLNWKNHILAKEIKNLAFIYYQNDFLYEKYLKKNLKASWINEKDGFYKMLNIKEVAKEIQKSNVGLCLSFQEGCMAASLEYLLCGKPVVSVKSEGGRHSFYEDYFVKIVEPDCNKIKNAVDEFCLDLPDPIYIRNKTIQKIEKMKNCFIDCFLEIAGISFEKINQYEFKSFNQKFIL